ncbi:hypothetical protein DHEL01_v209980 [Diaporthe helianthi]|uniref:Uncharacterized protein n=1 Tax=Diaporthe helianthi TaxID=158607 RepID=A0A2P5HMZ7_DIAHE|nr:hypothetical protein DHEL01_v209980 [Diaporthe helianthi]
MQVEPRNSHGSISQESQYGGGAATQHWATSQLHDDIATRSFSRRYFAGLPACQPSAWSGLLACLAHFAPRAMGRHSNQNPAIQCVQYLRLSWNDKSAAYAMGSSGGGKSWEVPRERSLIMLLDLTAGQGHKFDQLTPSTFMHAGMQRFPHHPPNHCWPSGLIAANDRFLLERRHEIPQLHGPVTR